MTDPTWPTDDFPDWEPPSGDMQVIAVWVDGEFVFLGDPEGEDTIKITVTADGTFTIEKPDDA